MPIPEWIEDTELSVMQAKRAKREPLSFMALNSLGSGPPWVIIGTDAKVSQRFIKAKRAGKEAFEVSKRMMGRVEYHANRLIFVYDEGSTNIPGNLPRVLSREWPGALEAAAGEAKSIKVLAKLMRKALVYTSAEALERPWEKAPPPEDEDEGEEGEQEEATLTREELEAFFGEDTAAVEEAAPRLEASLRKLARAGRTEQVETDVAPLARAVKGFTRTSGSPLADTALSAVEVAFEKDPGLLQSLAQRLEGPSPEPELLDAVAEVGRLEALFMEWERRVVRLEALKEAIDDLPDDTTPEDRAELVAQHGEASNQADVARKLVLEANERIEAKIGTAVESLGSPRG